MKKILLILIILLLVYFVGCTQEKDPSTQTLEKILAKAENYTNLEYDMETNNTITGVILKSKVYQKGEKYRVESEAIGLAIELKTTAIFDGKNFYAYIYEDDIYIKSETSLEEVLELMGVESEPESNLLDNPTLKEIGREKLNGLNTRVITYTTTATKPFGPSEEVQVKSWISEKYGIMVKSEIEMETGKMFVELKNIKIGSVKDSVFEVPKDKVKTSLILIPFNGK